MSTIRGALQGRLRSARSMKSQMGKLKKGEMPTDMGLLPNTIIRPRAADMPALFSKDWRRRLKVEWLCAFQQPADWFRWLYGSWWLGKKDINTGKRKSIFKMRYLLSERYSIARDLHRRLYTAIAKGDREEIDKIACTGLARQVMIKLDHRRALGLKPENWTVEYKGWTPNFEKPGILRWMPQAFCPPRLKSTRIVSDKSNPLPMGKDSTLRQVVVQINSRQKLDKKDGKGVKQAEKSEFLVIQKIRLDGEDGDWMVWGTTQRTTKEQLDQILDELEQNTAGQNFFGKVQDKMTEMAGKGDSTNPTV